MYRGTRIPRPWPGRFGSPAHALSGATAHSGMSLTEGLVVVCWLFLVFNDTHWRGLLPASAVLRAVVPLLLVIALVASRVPMRLPNPGTVQFWLVGFVGAAVLSTLAGNVPLLAAIKLALYLGVMLPLLHPAIAGEFAPGGGAIRRLTIVAVILLAVHTLLKLKYPGGLMLAGPQGLGGFALMLLPFMLLLEGSEDPRARRIGRVAALLCLGLAVWARVRGAVLAMSVALIVFYLLRRRRGLSTVAVLTMAALALVVYLAVVSDRALVYDDPEKETILGGERTMMFEECVENWMKRPILGYGFGLTHRISPEMTDDVLETGRLSIAAGELGSSTFGLLLGGGILLTVACYGLIASIYLAGFRAYVSPGLSPAARRQMRALLASIAGMMVIAQSENWLTAPLVAPTLIFWLFNGMVLYLASTCQMPSYGLAAAWPWRRQSTRPPRTTDRT